MTEFNTSSIMVETNSFENSISKFREHAKKLDELFKKMETIMKDVDGENSIWKGKTATIVRDKYRETESKYSDITDEFNDINEFLQTTLDAVNKEHENENKILDENSDNLDIN
jgi:uncharacterized protein YukE